jgi:primary-amine oxidase
MRILKTLALPLTLAFIVGLAWLLNQSIVTTSSSTEADIAVSPWDGLRPKEYAQAAGLLKAVHGDAVMFTRISLRQPEKAVALAWQDGDTAQRGAEVTFLVAGKPRLARLDLTGNRIVSDAPMTGGQPMLSGTGELEPIVVKLSEHADVLAALAKRGVEPGQGICLPRTIGRFFTAQANPARERLLRLDCFNIAGDGALGILPSTNLYARPIEGLAILYNITTDEIIEIKDTRLGNAPPHDLPTGEFNNGTRKVKHVAQSRPDGVNYKMTGSRIDWQGWQFRLRFDPRQGTVINRIGHQTESGFRSVAYEIAMSEMFVPYHDNDPNWFYRAYFDMGEYGFGNLATELQQADCPSHAQYLNVDLHLPDGSPMQSENRICIFEHDPGHPIWRHEEPLLAIVPGLETHQSRRATELVVRMVATIGNYDYYQDYVFGLDGRLRIRLISTGLDATKAVMSADLSDPRAADETATGTLIAPHRLAVNHDHYFSYRIDMDVDGQANNFERHMLRAAKPAAGAPRRGLWEVVPGRIATEKQAQTDMSAKRPAVLLFANEARQNAMGYDTGYQLMMPNVKPLVTPMDETFKRAYFVQKNLWVTRFKRDEIFATGVSTNQSAPWLGLPEYIADNEQLENTDIVGWATMGFHHVPMAEDWPVMPSKVDEIVLKPRNFFDRNPAIDLRD